MAFEEILGHQDSSIKKKKFKSLAKHHKIKEHINTKFLVYVKTHWEKIKDGSMGQHSSVNNGQRIFRLSC